MKKNINIKDIIILSVLTVLGIVWGVFYILYPDATISLTKRVLNFISTKPLPVIGISILTLFLLILKVISVTGIGNKSLAECKRILKAADEKLKEAKEIEELTKSELLAFEEQIKEENNAYFEKNNNNIKLICSKIPNKNIKELGEKLYGTEENSETTVE